ncbi:hypothetical protein D3C76_778970 [compost metagenome]
MLAAYFGLQAGNGRLHVGDSCDRFGAQFGTVLDLRAGALQFGRVALEKALQLSLEVKPCVLGLGFHLTLQAHQCGKVVIARCLAGYAQQWQGFDTLYMSSHGRQFTFDIGGQLATPATDQLFSCGRQACQVLRGAEQRGLIANGIGIAAAVGITCQLLEVCAHFPFGLHQQGLWVACQLPCREQLGAAESLQGFQARTDLADQFGGQFTTVVLQGRDSLGSAAMA